MLRLRSPVSASQPFVCLVLCCDSATASIYTLSLHDALPISVWDNAGKDSGSGITFTTDAEYNTDIAFLPKISFGFRWDERDASNEIREYNSADQWCVDRNPTGDPDNCSFKIGRASCRERE